MNFRKYDRWVEVLVSVITLVYAYSKKGKKPVKCTSGYYNYLSDQESQITEDRAVADPDLELRGAGGFFECTNPPKNLASIFPRIYT